MKQEAERSRKGGVDTGARVVVGWGLGLACFVYLLSLPPTLNPGDEGFLLYEAKRLLQGDAIYRDFFDFLTPGSFYFYALAYAVGGLSITSAKVATALLHALSVVGTYFLALRVASVGEAVLAGVLVVVICVPVFNVASHHWMTTALGLAAAAVLLAPRWHGSSQARPAAVGMLAGLVVCTHQGRGIWLMAWLGVAISLLALGQAGERRWRRWRGEMAWTAAGGAVVCFTLLGYAVWHSSLAEMWYATYTWVLENYRHYNVGSTFFHARLPWAFSFFPRLRAYTYPWLLESIPALLAIEAAVLLWVVFRRGLGAQLVRVILFVLALSAIAGIAYFPGIGHVAFVTPFALPVLAGMVYRARTSLPILQKRPARALALAAWIGAMAVLLGKGWTNRQLGWQDNPLLIDSAFGTIAASPMQRNTLNALREKIHVDPLAPPRLFAYPSDAWIYLMLPADNPTPFCLLRPRYNTPEQFQIAREHLERDPQALIFLVVNLRRREDREPFVQYIYSHFHKLGQTGYGTLYGKYPRDRAATAATP